ncbi:MAG: MDR family MFS transporter [Bacillus sp. (in: firmicutes)]
MKQNEILVRKKENRIILAIIIADFIAVYQIVSLNTSLPGFISIFNSDLATVQWLMTGFTLAAGVVAPICGYLSDRFGNRHLFLWALVGVLFSSILCSLAWDIHSLILFRVLQGIACGLIQPVTLTIIFQMLPEHRRTKALGLWSTVSVLGPTIAPTMSGWLQTFNYHFIFILIIPLGVFAFVCGWKNLEQTPTQNKQKLDKKGLVSVVSGTFTLLILFTNLYAWGVLSVKVALLFLISSLSLVYFIRRSLKIKEPLLQMTLIRNKVFTLALFTSTILMIGLLSCIYFVPLYLVEIHKLTTVEVGLLLLPSAICMIIATMFASKYYPKVGPLFLILSGTLLMIIASWEFSNISLSTSKWEIMWLMVLRCIGVGLSMNPVMNLGMSSVSNKMSSHASALFNWFKQVIGALSIGILTSFFYIRESFHLEKLQATSKTSLNIVQQAYVNSIDDVFSVATILTCLSLPFLFFIRQKKESAKVARQNKKIEEEYL